ncbi:MAG: hypothetical protein OXG09_00005 [Chloroflexi bacterium]|nr:hypothetical protein [Chloroflexota bacterium]MCY3958695.1 hypothetical protein [Chloroflexota bacterium]
MAHRTALENPTVVVPTDRNDLDDQLFGTFSHCEDLPRRPPTQVQSRSDLRNGSVRRRRGTHNSPIMGGTIRNRKVLGRPRTNQPQDGESLR